MAIQLFNYTRLIFLFRRDIASFANFAARESDGTDVRIERSKNPLYLEGITDLIDKATLERLISKNADFLIAKKNGTVVGCFVNLMDTNDNLSVPFEYHFAVNNDSAYGMRLLVKKEFRNKGIGKRLYQEAFCIGKEQKKKYFEVIIDYDNEPSLHLKDKLEFKYEGFILLMKLWSFRLVFKGKATALRLLATLFYKVYRKILIKKVTYSGKGTVFEKLAEGKQ